MAIRKIETADSLDQRYQLTIADHIIQNDHSMFGLVDPNTLAILACNDHLINFFVLDLSTDTHLDDILLFERASVAAMSSSRGADPVINLLYAKKRPDLLICHLYAVEGGLLFIANKRDVTDLDLVETMSRLNTDLASQTRELRRQKHQVELSKEIIIEQSRRSAVNDIVKMLSHQWRQPLSLFSTMSANLQLDIELDGISSEQIIKKLKKMDGEVQKFSSEITGLQSLFVSSGHAKNVDVCVLIEKVIALIREKAASHGISITLECAKQIDIILIGTDLVQSLLAIFENSLDALLIGDSDRPTIKVSLEESSTTLKINIEDNGGGFAEGDKGRLFEPYFSTKSFNGKGLGLYITHILITERLKGKVIASNIEEGARFTIELPKDSA